MVNSDIGVQCQKRGMRGINHADANASLEAS
ncbi:hypothetical protein X734_23010 [Mesorhizobium sp. L2C084A000]|nr:hypothetical protein X734_23010 [Mesorhizobium sp. L2C084A000]